MNNNSQCNTFFFHSRKLIRTLRKHELKKSFEFIAKKYLENVQCLFANFRDLTIF